MMDNPTPHWTGPAERSAWFERWLAPGRPVNVRPLVGLMPDRTKLKIGDRIRLLRVPAGESSRWTKVTIGAIIRQDPVVTIDRIDEYGQPWFNYNLARPNGRVAEHTLAVMEDDSWVPV